MGKVIILPGTTREPITKMGEMAGVCWGADTADASRNYRRGLDCIESGHGRVMEFVNVEMVLDGYSARVMREWYTHIGCLPARLQSSTRYIDYGRFDYIVPETVQANAKALERFNSTMSELQMAIRILEEDYGIPREDAALLLPFGMTTRVVDKRNLRNLVDMSHTRECVRAYWEFREMFGDLKKALADYSEEWEWIVRTQFKPKCEVLGYCPEKHGCGRKAKNR